MTEIRLNNSRSPRLFNHWREMRLPGKLQMADNRIRWPSAFVCADASRYLQRRYVLDMSWKARQNTFLLPVPMHFLLSLVHRIVLTTCDARRTWLTRIVNTLSLANIGLSIEHIELNRLFVKCIVTFLHLFRTSLIWISWLEDRKTYWLEKQR